MKLMIVGKVTIAMTVVHMEVVVRKSVFEVEKYVFYILKQN